MMGPRQQGFVEKLFSTPLSAGWSALYDGSTEEFVAFTFDPAQVPFMGICQIRDGWPDGAESAYTTILEPCSGWPDRLDVAVERGAHVTVPPYGNLVWSVNMHIGQGEPALERAINHSIDN
jgi:hypothetical protein